MHTMEYIGFTTLDSVLCTTGSSNTEKEREKNIIRKEIKIPLSKKEKIKYTL